MRCCVQNCTYNNKRTAKSHGITFHLFPKDTKVRAAWIAAIGSSDRVIKETSSVCSEHFRDEDFCETAGGLRRIRHGALPVVRSAEQDMNSLAAMKVCRICLAINRKMYHISQHKLDKALEQIIAPFQLSVDDKLPQKVCWECAQRLMNCYQLKDRALRSQNLMLDLLITRTQLTIRDIKTINRTKNNLKSTLVSKTFASKDHHFQITKDKEESWAIIKQEVVDDDINPPSLDDLRNNLIIDYDISDIGKDVNETSDLCKDMDNIANINDNSDGNYLSDVDNNIVESNEKKMYPSLVELEIKHEHSNSEIYFDEVVCRFSESDDDIKLSEVCKSGKREKKIKKKKLKVKKEKAMKKVRKKEKHGDKAVLSRKELEDPGIAADKYKQTDVIRRKQDTLDESLFTITPLTYEEQAAEVAQRQDSAAYKNAPYKCTVCFRGFLVRDRYEAHVVRHTEASGAFECFICKSRLKTARALRKHLTAQHTEKFSCKGCPFVTRNRGVAREHGKWHAGTRYQCPHCPTEFDKLTTYMGHIRIKHVSDFVCELCGYAFVSQKGIDVHKKKKHRLDKPLTLEGPYCDVCEVRFISEEAFSRHMKLSSRHSSDSDPNRIRNDSQSMNAERNGRVMRHIERRPTIHPRDPASREAQLHSQGPVTCEQCGVQLRDLRLYAQHFRREHPDKNRTKYPAMKTPCMCEQCGRIFQSMALLKDHMWVHTGQKRFKCDLCDKSFTQKTNLVFHLRVHSATRPTFECPLCGKQFAFFNNRRRHMFIHTGLKPYKCDTCGKCFTTTGEQRAHVEHVHLKKPWPKRARAQRGLPASHSDAWPKPMDD